MTDLAQQNGLDPGLQALRQDALTLGTLIQQLQGFILFVNLGARPLPPEALEDAAERLERLVLLLRQRAG